jgi:hypothetical protein
MSTRLATVAFLDNQGQLGPVYRSIFAVDLEGSTMRTNPVKGELRRVMYDLLGHALEAVGITGNRIEHLTDRGDGVLALIRPHDDVPKTALLDRLIPLLATLLAEYNAQAAEPALRIRLRAVVHAGEVHMDKRGWYGEAIDVAIRLLDAPAVKQALKEAADPLALVVSDEIYSGIVAHGYTAGDTYRPLVRVRVADRWRRGWVRIPAPAVAAAAVAAVPVRQPADAPRAAAFALADERAEQRVATIAGRGSVTRAGPAAG